MKEKENNKTWLIIGAGTVVVLGLGYLGYKEYMKRQDQQDDGSSSVPPVDTSAFIKSLNPGGGGSSSSKKPALPKGNNEFPLKKGSRGSNVVKLQQALMIKYGSSVLPKYGADGIFGNEVTTALQHNNLPATIDQATFNTLIASSLGSIEPFKLIMTKWPALVWKNDTESTQVPANIILGYSLEEKDGHTLFISKDNRKFIIKSDAVKYAEQ